MSKENLAKFMQQVQLDPSLQQKLAAAPDKEQASRLAVELGAQLGLEFTHAEAPDLDYPGEPPERALEAVAGGGMSRYSGGFIRSPTSRLRPFPPTKASESFHSSLLSALDSRLQTWQATCLTSGR